VRDYVHVVDVARGHFAALVALQAQKTGVLTVNAGTGRGYSLLEMVRAFEKASGKRVPYRIVPHRPGDVAQCYADPSLAARILDGERNWASRQCALIPGAGRKRRCLSCQSSASYIKGISGYNETLARRTCGE
jgi:UDP-glucose 4-epimerase